MRLQISFKRKSLLDHYEIQSKGHKLLVVSQFLPLKIICVLKRRWKVEEVFVTVLRGKSCLQQGVLATCLSGGGGGGAGPHPQAQQRAPMGPREVGLLARRGDLSAS